MATRKSRGIEREPLGTAGVPTAAAPRSRAARRHEAPERANIPAARPALRLVKPAKDVRSPALSTVPAAATPKLAAHLAAPATQLPLRFPQPLLALPAALSATVEHTSPAPTQTRRVRNGAGHIAPVSAHPAPPPVHIPTTTHPAPATPPNHPALHAAHAAPRLSVRARLGELREALADGFEIVQPIFARPLWSVSDDSTTAFNFVLRRELTTRLVTVPEGRTVQRFIRERQLLVDYRR